MIRGTCKVGDLVWTIGRGMPHAVRPGLVTRVIAPTHIESTWDKYEVLVDGQKKEFYAESVCESEEKAEKVAVECRRNSVSRTGQTYLESGFVYAPYVPLEVTPTLVV